MPKLAALMDEAEPDVLAYMGFPAAHRVKLHSTNPLERLIGEIKRRTEVIGIGLASRKWRALFLKEEGSDGRPEADLYPRVSC